MCTIDRFLGLSAMFSPARRRRGVAVDAGVAPSLARARRDQCRGGGALIAARVTARLEQRDQPPLPARVAVDIALGHLYRLVAGQQLQARRLQPVL
jgi:hypothetical protein